MTQRLRGCRISATFRLWRLVRWLLLRHNSLFVLLVVRLTAPTATLFLFAPFCLLRLHAFAAARLTSINAAPPLTTVVAAVGCTFVGDRGSGSCRVFTSFARFAPTERLVSTRSFRRRLGRFVRILVLFFVRLLFVVLSTVARRFVFAAVRGTRTRCVTRSLTRFTRIP